MSIYLIRHGKTAATEKHLYCGKTDLPLSDAGCLELKNKHFNIQPQRFVTSGLKRCNETLRILFGNVPYDVDERFQEVDFGIFEMHSYEQLKSLPAYKSWIAGDNLSNIAPQGESYTHMKTRVLKAFGEIEDETCIVAHGGVIAAIMQYLFPSEHKNLYEWQPQPGAGYTVTKRKYHKLWLKT